jgi:hypothetical protein
MRSAKSLLLVIGSLSSLLAGCGGSICERSKAVGQSMRTKAEPCKASLGNLWDVTYGAALDISNEELRACEAAVKDCTAAEREQAEKRLDCYDKVPTCDPNNRTAFEQGTMALAECTTGFTELRPSCYGAL